MFIRTALVILPVFTALPSDVPGPRGVFPEMSRAVPGETLPKGPPWQVTYRAARRDALRHGRPVFVYFTKSY